MTTAADPFIYPQPRPGRGAGAAVEELLPTRAPRMRVISFQHAISANVRNSVSTPRLQGPLIIKGITLEPSFGADPPNCTIEIGTSPLEVTETLVALGTPRPYTVLTELVDPFNQILGAAGQGLLLSNVALIGRWHEIPLDLIVTDPETFIVVATLNATGLAAFMPGKLRILEAVDPEALRFFL